MSKPIPIGYFINIKNEPYIPENWDSIITPTRLLITIKYKNQIIERYYLSLGINASRENIIQRLNQHYIQ
jgi:hypothetical protein